MSSQPSGSKRKRVVGSAAGNLLHPGEWINKRSRSGSPSASGAATPITGCSTTPAHSNNSSRSPSPTGHSGSLNDPADTRMPPHDATLPDSRAKLGVPTSSRISKGSAWTGLERALRALRVTTIICPSLSTAVDELVSCLPMFEVAAKNHKDYHDLTTGLEDIVNQLARHLDGTTSKAIIDTITNIADAIRKEIASIDVQQSHNLPRRMLRASNTEDDLIRRYRRIEQLFRQLQGEADMSTWNTVDELRVEQYLKDLRPAKLARFNSELSTEINRRRCTHGTRTKILEDSATWSEDPDLAKVYWMNGMAGTGKTTIAYSLCERLEAGKQLAASFFCTRTSPECREAKRIIPTIAYQLARRFTPFRYSLCQQLKQDPDISTGQLSDQFDLLLKQPLLAAKDKLSNNLIIVVDALDECSDPHIVELFLDLLFRSVMELPVKFFVTSRPEPAIRNKMMPESEHSRSILYLHEIERSLVQADIELYLREELASISPADDDITELAEQASTSFLHAATVVHYIRPIGRVVNSKARLKAILVVSTESSRPLSAIDALYTAILTDALYDECLEPQEQELIRLVLHTAICACEPILIRTLSALCGLEGKDHAIAALQPLQSVLHVSEHSELVTTLHSSFPDYMFSHERSGAFYCDKFTHSQLLAEHCFKIMKAQLRFNICSIPSSFIPNDKIPELGERIIANISEELFYSCRFWVDHLRETCSSDIPLLWAYDFLCHQLLFWMEVMSLKGTIAIGVMIMIKLNTWLSQMHPGSHIDLPELASDAQVFVEVYASSPASTHTPHIYLSALPFTRPSSPVRLQYLPHYEGLIKVSDMILEKVGKVAIGTWVSTSSICSATFSPHSDLIILGDEKGRISVQDAHGRYTVRPFKAHKQSVASLAVSSDGMQIVSGSDDAVLSIWNIHNGSAISGPYQGHTNRVTSVAFSPDAAHIASGSYDCSIHIWSPQTTNSSIRSLIGHAKAVNSVAFAPDGSRVISGSADQTIRVWNVSSGTTVFVLKGHTGPVSSIQLSLHGTHIISGSDDSTVRIWKISHGSLSCQLGHSEPITSTAISHNGHHIVSGSIDCTVHVWDMHTGEQVAGPFKGHTGSVVAVGISSDGKRVMSASNDRTVREWNVWGRTPQVEKIPKEGFDPTVELASSLQTHVGIYDSTEPKIHVWDLRTMTHVAISTGFKIKYIQLSLDAGRIHSLHSLGIICTWDTQTALLLGGPHNCSPYEQWDTAACSMDGTRVVFCRENKVALWHVQSGQSMAPRETRHRFALGRLRATFSQDGSRFLTAGYSTTPMSEVWDGDSGAFVAGPFWGETVGLSFDGTFLCSRYTYGSYDLIYIYNGKKSRIQSDSDPIFTPDGLHVAGRDGRHIRMWNMQGQIFASVEIPSAATALKYSKVLGCSSDGWLLLSDRVQRGRQLCRFHIEHPPFVMNPAGWVMNGERQPLFWVPADIREDFPGCNGVLMSRGDEIVQRVEYDDMHVGDDWSQCYIPDIVT